MIMGEKRRAALLKGDEAEAAYDARQDDGVNAAVPLLPTKNGNPDDSTCAPSVDTQPEQEIISKGKEALNGHLIDNTNGDEEPNDPTCNPSVDQESNPDPSAVTPEPNSQTENNSIGKETLSGDQHANTNEDGIDKVTETAVDSREQQQEPPAEQVGDDQGESGQNSRPEEPESTTEEPENNSNSKETLNGDQHANTNEDGIDKVNETSDSMEQQQVPLAQQVGDDIGESGQNSIPEEPEPTADGPETSPLESRSEETPDTVSSES
ncbi:PREDICTED: clumping factor B-like [Poecilia mexicana]|uniref:clumping factor B-like n=1 Tax=Poecilia mexicana TaxID=48701 RepID=UPI00072DE592|nr:PREDICTED: clumping factor B-like [Poecilia mexicana]